MEITHPGEILQTYREEINFEIILTKLSKRDVKFASGIKNIIFVKN